MLRQEALKYKTRSEFEKGNVGAYYSARRKGFLDEVCSHMPKRSLLLGKKHPRFKWSFETLKKEASKYNTRTEFQKANGSAYNTALKKGFLDKICSHMIERNHRWSVDELRSEALKYVTNEEFRQKNLKAYNAILERGLLDKLCFHLLKKEIPSGENHYNFRWTDEMVRKEALKYNTRTEFKKNSSAYNVAYNRNTLDEVCKHMKCPGGISASENFLFNEIKKIYPKTQRIRFTKINIPNKPHIQGFDIDAYVPECRKGIEFDGTYWHSVKGLRRSRSHWPKEDLENYHQIKDDYFKSKGIEILHISEKEWLEDREQSLNKALNFLRE